MKKNDCNGVEKIQIAMLVIKYSEKNQTLILNNPKGVDMPFNR